MFEVKANFFFFFLRPIGENQLLVLLIERVFAESLPSLQKHAQGR